MKASPSSYKRGFITDLNEFEDITITNMRDRICRLHIFRVWIPVVTKEITHLNINHTIGLN